MNIAVPQGAGNCLGHQEELWEGTCLCVYMECVDLLQVCFCMLCYVSHFDRPFVGQLHLVDVLGL